MPAHPHHLRCRGRARRRPGSARPAASRSPRCRRLDMERRSTHSRTAASRSAGVRDGPSHQRPAVLASLAAVPGADREHRLRVRKRRAAMPARAASATIGAGSARSARVTATTPCLTPKASRAARCSAACGIHGSSAATTNSTAGTGPTPASMVDTNRSWPGTSTNATSPDRRAASSSSSRARSTDHGDVPRPAGPDPGRSARAPASTCRGRHDLQWR